MIGIDWSKAPESATHYDSRQYVWPAFMRKSPDSGTWEYLAPSGWEFYGPMHDADVAEMTVRPASEEQCAHDYANKYGCPECGEASSPDWSGEGLPPVGAVCEWKEKTGFQWVAATVLFITESSVVMQRSDGFEWQMLTKRTVFRPVRTPEQIAADEQRLHAIRNALTTIKAARSFPGDVARQNVLVATVEAMIDAGYCKQAKP